MSAATAKPGQIQTTGTGPDSPAAIIREVKSSPPGDTEDFVHQLTLGTMESEYLDQRLSVLTKREKSVVMAICAGGTNEAIARRLGIALPTLRTHLMKVNGKLHTSSKGDIVRTAAMIVLNGYRAGLLSKYE